MKLECGQVASEGIVTDAEEEQSEADQVDSCLSKHHAKEKPFCPKAQTQKAFSATEGTLCHLPLLLFSPSGIIPPFRGRRRSLRKYFQRCFRPVDSPLTLLRAFQETGAEQPAVYITKCQLEDAVSALWVFSSGCRTTPSVIFVSLQCTELLRCKQKAPGATNNT